MNQAPHRQQYFPASLPPLPLTTAMGQGKAGGGGGHTVGSVGTGVDGEESGRGEERVDMEESEGAQKSVQNWHQSNCGLSWFYPPPPSPSGHLVSPLHTTS